MTINFDQKFIKTLRQKLTVGNARSVHLNSLPGRYATRLDLSNLSSVKENLPDDFIKTPYYLSLTLILKYHLII